MIEADRLITPEASTEDEVIDRAIRPKMLEDYTGQPHVCEQMEIFIQAARNRDDALDHLLIFGPPGLGKTTLANIVANEMGVNIKTTSGPVLEKAGDLAALLTNLERNDVLFIDEIHRLSPVVEEILYPAMEDYQLDIMIGEGPSARSIKLDLPPFTLVGATTRAGSLTSPLRDRFGIVQRLEFYNVKDLTSIVARSASYLNLDMSEEGAQEVARRSRGTPRIANRLLRRVRDYAEIKSDGTVVADVAAKALDMLDVDKEGFDYMDRKLLSAIIEKLSKQKKGKLHRYTKDAIEHLINTQGNGISTTFQAVHRLREMSFRDKFISFGNIEKSRKAELPSGFYERRADVVLHRYATKLARRVAYVENFGPKGEKMLGRIKELERRDPKAARMATEMFDQLTGIVELNPDKGYSPLTKKFLDEWMSFSVGTKIGLGLATIPNITQSLISTIADAGYMNFFRSAIKGATESRRKFVRTSGAINYNVNKQMFGQRHDSYLSKVADKITFFSGFQTINKINNWLAASTAADWIPKLIKQANAKTERTFKVGGKTFSKRDWAREKLKDLNIDYKKKMTEETITKGMVKFARDSQLQKSVLKDPQFFNSPAGRPLVTFKRFGLRQFYYSKDLMWKDYKRGNVLPTIRMAMGGMAGGVGVIWAKNEIRELLSGEPHYRDDVGAKAVIENIAAVGAFGVATDIVASESIVRSLGFLVTPVQLSDTAKIYSAVLAFEKDLQEGYGLGEASHRSVMRVAGVFGTLTKEAAKRIQPEEQKKNRILQLKGVRRNEILDLFIESQDLAGKGKREKAIKVREEGEKKWELWNKAYRNMGYYTDKERRWKSFGLTTEELSYKEILRKVAERREKRVGKKYA